MKLFKKRNGKTEAGLRMLQTERLVLRVFDMSDAVDVFAYAQSSKVGLMAGWAAHQTLEDSQSVVQGFVEKGETWAIVEKKSGKVIGSVGLHKDAKRDIENVRMLGYVLGEAWWGMGYATEAAAAVLRHAFDEEGCAIVSAYHFPENNKSKRVIKKLGFVYEGELRMASALPDGSVRGNVCYSMTREEFQKNAPGRG